MYDVGNIIYIINAGGGALGANNSIGVITSKPSSNGLLDCEEGFNVKLDFNCGIWRVNNGGQYILCPYTDEEKIKEWKSSLMLMLEIIEPNEIPI